MPDTWFTADPHFGHANIIRHCKRPFSNVEEMDAAMIARWNAVVKPVDTVYVVGDYAYRCSFDYAYETLKGLNGFKHILLGNHDDLAKKIAHKHTGAWASVSQRKEIKIHGQKIVLDHYSMRSWHHDIRGAWHLFGHVHGLLPPFGKSMDVGVDVWNFTPINFEQVAGEMAKLEIGPHPGFEGYVPEEETGVEEKEEG